MQKLCWKSNAGHAPFCIVSDTSCRCIMEYKEMGTKSIWELFLTSFSYLVSVLGAVMTLPYEEIRRETDNFNDVYKIGAGSFGTVYYMMHNHTKYAIKRLHQVSLFVRVAMVIVMVIFTDNVQSSQLPHPREERGRSGVLTGWQSWTLYTLSHLENNCDVSAHTRGRRLSSRAQLVWLLTRSNRNTRIDA